MFTSTQKSKSPTPSRANRESEASRATRESELPKKLSDILKETDIVQVLEIEERLASSSSTLLDIENAVLLYAVGRQS